MNDATELASGPRSRVATTLGAALYLALALGVAALVVGPALPALGRAQGILLAALTAAAFVLERTSLRRHDPLWRNAAPAVYLAAVLLLPAPWAVAAALAAVTACQVTTRGVAAAARLACLAQTTLVVALCALIARARPGAGDGAVLNYLASLVGASGAAGAWPAGAWQSAHALLYSVPAATLHVANVALLAGCYSVLETLGLGLIGLLGLGAATLLPATPPVATQSVVTQPLAGRGMAGAAGRGMGGAVAQLGALCCGALAALAAQATPALGLVALPALWGLHVAMEGTRGESGRARGRGATAQLGARLAAQRVELERERAVAAESAARLETVLAAMRALGATAELGEVARTLAAVATRLTPFRGCVVYLYEWSDGAFHARDAAGGAGEAIPRARVEALMAEQNLLGYSYWVRRGYRADPACAQWQAGDLLLAPLGLRHGEVIGYLALDGPAGAAYTPTAADLAPLETVAALAASVIARLRHTEQALFLAATDGLTGLLNRRSFEERLRRDVATAARSGSALSLLMVDIDDFGGVNNRYGHPVGDAALRLVAGVVREHLREGDAGCRYGGDEFAVILPGLEAERALEIAERLRVALAEATTQAAGAGALPLLHTSIGVAAYPADAGGMEELIKAADDALYQSKRLGKNRVSLWRVA